MSNDIKFCKDILKYYNQKVHADWRMRIVSQPNKRDNYLVLGKNSTCVNITPQNIFDNIELLIQDALSIDTSINLETFTMKAYKFDGNVSLQGSAHPNFSLKHSRADLSKGIALYVEYYLLMN